MTSSGRSGARSLVARRERDDGEEAREEVEDEARRECASFWMLRAREMTMSGNETGNREREARSAREGVTLRSVRYDEVGQKLNRP